MDTDQSPDARCPDTGEAQKYTPPMIVDYGDLVELTAGANGGTHHDGNSFMHSSSD